MSQPPDPAAQPSPVKPNEGGAHVAKKKTPLAPKILMVLGGLILLPAIIAGAIMLVRGVDSFAANTDDYTIVNGSGSFTAEAGDEVVIYKEDGESASYCEVVTPNDAELQPGPSGNYAIAVDGKSWESYDSFTAPASGEYSVDCGGGEVMFGPPVDVSGILGSLGGILLGVFGGGLGALLFLIGLIWWLIARKR